MVEDRIVDEKLEDYTLEQLEVKKRLCEAKIKEITNYSIMHRISKKIGHDIYRILGYLLLIEIVAFVTVIFLIMTPMLLEPSQENAQLGMNYLPVTVGFIFPIMITAMLFGTDQTITHRRRLKDINRVIIIKKEVAQGDKIEVGDESESLEYKSSFKYDYKTKQPNPKLMHEIVQSVVGFLNGSGGLLRLGVNDNKQFIGIENDLKLFNNNWNEYQQAIQNCIGDHSSMHLSDYVTLRRIEKENKIGCDIEINQSPKPVFFIDGNSRDFYVRDGNTTIKLSTQKALDYVDLHWFKDKK